ncbi:MAG: HD domain-containing protein, partial [Planctomycetota bacterium]|nr:HD domain-containing protein [Planctomycetota bacterium]
MGKAFFSTWVIVFAFMSLATAEELTPFNDAEKRAIRAATTELVAASSKLSGTELARLNHVIVFAKKAHGEMRRHGGEPAILHSLRVSTKVATSPHSTKTSIYAAVLHDVVEDTKVRVKPIRKAYGANVADAVLALSLDPVEAFSNNKEARDKAYYERFSKASRAAHLVKLYDRMDNIRDMRGFTHEGKLGYLQSTRDKVIKALSVKSPDLAKILEADVTRLEKAVRQSIATEAVERSLKNYRRADGTLQWKKVAADRVLPHAGGVAHFALALFLKEMAVVVKTGDKGRIEEFFEGLATTDFFVTYGLFSAGAHAGNVAYAKYLEKYIKPKFVSGILRTNLVLATGMALPEIYHGTFSGQSFAINLAGLGLSSSAVKAGVSSIKWVARLRTSRAARLATRFSRVKRFASIGGWVYTAAETAVVLYFGDEISKAINKYLN